jgi:hypothetical protein
MGPSNPETDTQANRPAETEFSWAALLAAFRLGPRERWSGLLIERLGPWLIRARQRLIAVPPLLDRDDIAQQLVLEVLRIAARWRPQCEDCWIPRKLVEAAERRVRKRLSRERSSLAVELNDQLHAPQIAELELFDTPIGQASAADLRVLYRVKVLGEQVSVLALEAGVTPRQMRQRVWAARKRARAASTAGVERD